MALRSRSTRYASQSRSRWHYDGEVGPEQLCRNAACLLVGGRCQSKALSILLTEYSYACARSGDKAELNIDRDSYYHSVRAVIVNPYIGKQDGTEVKEARK